MSRQRRRARVAPRPEVLEARSLLSGGAGPGLLIGFEPGTPAGTVGALVGRLGGEVLERFDDGPVWVEPGPGVDLGRVVAWLGRQPAVRYVETNGLVRVRAVTPDDPGLGLQWGLNNTGTDVDVDAPEAWGVTTGSPDVIVAVIDSGLDLTHPDFAGRLWVNAAEAGGRPGFDDDGDGLVDDVFGWNFRDRNNNLSDLARHGTHIAGILAARANDGLGVAGVDWNARIMPLKFIGADGSGAIADAVQAIYYAVQHGARVINASWGGTDYSRALYDAIAYAGSRGVVFVTAAGNESVNNDRVASYPALNRTGNALSVAAVDAFGRLASFSNYGARTVDVAAPGVSIYSAVPGGGYASFSGTSMATPFVSGIASLLIGLHPEWTAARVVQQIVATAKPLPSLRGLTISGGVASAGRAVGAIPVASTPGGGTVNPTVTAATYPAPGDLIRAEVLASDEAYAAQGGTDAGWLDHLYRLALGRPLDAPSAEYWVGRLAGESRLDVARAILASPEARRTKIARWMIGDLGWGATVESIKNLPDVVRWADLLAAGAGDSAIRQIILASPEYYARSGGTDAGWLDALYRLALGRPLDAPSRALWVGRLASGLGRSDVALAILTSVEARRLKVATWFRDDLRRTASLDSLRADPVVVALASRITD